MKRSLYLCLLLCIFFPGCTSFVPTKEVSDTSGDTDICIHQSACTVDAMDDDTNEGIYFYDMTYAIDDSEYLYYFDDASGQIVKLCRKINCRHNNENCDAYFGSINNSITLYNNRIYLWAFHNVPGKGNMASLYSVKSDGSDRTDYGFQNIDGTTPGAKQTVIYKDTLYMICDLGPSGNSSYSYKVFMQPLEHDQRAQLLYESPDQEREHSLSDLHTSDDTLWLTDTTYISSDSLCSELIAIDLRTGKPQTILTADNGRIHYTRKGSLIYYCIQAPGSGQYSPVHKFDPESKEDTIFAQQGGKLTFDGQYFFTAACSSDSRKADIYITDENGTLVKTIPSEAIQSRISKPHVRIFQHHIYIEDMDFDVTDSTGPRALIAEKNDLLKDSKAPWYFVTSNVISKISLE